MSVLKDTEGLWVQSMIEFATFRGKKHFFYILIEIEKNNLAGEHVSDSFDKSIQLHAFIINKCDKVALSHPST